MRPEKPNLSERVISLKKPKITERVPESGDISEDEFDNLLDELHGKGQFSAKAIQEEKKPVIERA